MTDARTDSGLPDGGRIGNVVKGGGKDTETHQQREPRRAPKDAPVAQICTLLNITPKADSTFKNGTTALS